MRAFVQNAQVGVVIWEPYQLNARRCAMNSVLMFWGTYILVLLAGLGLLGASWS
jgi:hypothetical protein